MVIFEIPPVEGRFGEFGELAHRVLLKCRCPVCRRMPEKDFLKKVLKSVNDFKNSGNIPDVADFLQKSGTVFRIFGNIPDVKIFLKKVGAISDFSHMYCMQDASSMRGGNAGGLFITFPEEVLSSKWHTNHSKSVIWQMKI